MGDRASKGRTKIARGSNHDLVVTRVFDAPVDIVYAAWTKPELFERWWAPKSSGVPLRSCDMDVQTGGGYRLAFGHDATNERVFFGKYIDVTPSRLVWTNDEGGDRVITTVTFEETGGKTLLTLREAYPSEEALDQSFSGMEDGMPEQFDQLDELLQNVSQDAPASS